MPPHAQPFYNLIMGSALKAHAKLRIVWFLRLFSMNIQALRILGLVEGLSFLMLLFVAMPLKYVWGNPILVKYVGMGHGILVIAFIVLLFIVCERKKWSLIMFIAGLAAAILPFGTFIFDRKLKKLQG